MAAAEVVSDPRADLDAQLAECDAMACDAFRNGADVIMIDLPDDRPPVLHVVAETPDVAGALLVARSEPPRRTPVTQRTPTGGRTRSSRRRSSSSRGSPRSDDDEPAPPSRAASRQNVIATPIAIDLLFVGVEPGALRRVECWYCGTRTRGVRGSVIEWWHSHACSVDEALAHRNRLLVLAQGGQVAA